MLQQTQTDQVIVPYNKFITRFPDFETLSRARFSSVLKVWMGLGYNRRAKYMWESAKRIISEYQGELPDDTEVLKSLPGIGSATAASISVFAFNRPTVFIETNIRTVFLYFFFKDRNNVTDREIMSYVEKMLDTKRPREWYSALMDYGVFLKNTEGNVNIRSKHYVKPTVFEGSNRQLRGAILRALTHAACSEEKLLSIIKKDRYIVQKNLKELEKEGMIIKKGMLYKV
ncbi:MAG: A/G-specific adenine glycosylase [bacterium]